jgi:phage baseplate assembly protein W
MNFNGAPYPIQRHPLGLMRTQRGVNQVKSDLLALLLTEPGERVMLPEFGTPLKQFFFEQNDSVIVERVKESIANSIRTWEPRIAVSAIEVTNSGESVAQSLNSMDNKDNMGHILMVRIEFTDFDDIRSVQELKLEIPLGG